MSPLDGLLRTISPDREGESLPPDARGKTELCKTFFNDGNQ